MRKTTPSSIRLVLLFWLLLTVVSSAPIAAAQEASVGLNMRAWAAFDGYFKYGEWLPIFVELQNDGVDLDSEIRIRIVSGNSATSYIQPAALPTQSRKRIVIYVIPNNFSREIQVELVSGDQLLASEKVKVNPQPPISYHIGIVSPQRGPLALLETVELLGQKRNKNLIDITIDEFPELYEALRSFDLLVFNDTDTAVLTVDQVDALETWVHRGGRLVIGGGVGAQKTLRGLPPTLLPIQIDQEAQVEELDGLEQYLSNEYPILLPGPFLIESGLPQSAYQLATQGDLPLIVEKKVGDGYINYVALDLTVIPFDAWNGTVHFWEKLIATGSSFPEWQPPDFSARQQVLGQIPYALSNLPMLDLPSVQGLTLLLIFYILLIGPINYLLLRWQKRLHWAWITIPLITLLFSGFAFGLGYFLHGDDLFANKISIIHLQPNDKAHVTSFLGIFSPGQRTYEIEVSNGLVSPVDAYTDPWSSFSASSGGSAAREISVVQGSPSIIQGFSIDQWSMQSFMAEGINIQFGNLKFDLLLENNQLTGEIHNDSQYTIQDATIILNKNVQYIGKFDPGTTQSITLSLSETNEPYYGPPISYQVLETMRGYAGSLESERQFETRRIIIESVLDQNQAIAFSSLSKSGDANSISGTPIFIGWMNESQPEIKIEGQTPNQQTTAMVYTALSYDLPETGLISIPAGMIPGKISQMPTFGGPCGESGATAVYLDRGEAIFDFTIPPDFLQIDITSIKLGFWNDSGFSDFPTIELFDWENNTWHEVDVKQGLNIIPQSTPIIRPDGLVKLRVAIPEDQGPRGACYFFSMGLEAIR